MENKRERQRAPYKDRVSHKFFSCFTRCWRCVFLCVYGTESHEQQGFMSLVVVRRLPCYLFTYSSSIIFQ